MTTSVVAQAKRRAERAQILAALNDGWSMNQDIAEVTGLKTYIVAANLADMCDSGIIIRKRRGVYHVADKSVEPPIKIEPVVTGIFGRIIKKINAGFGTD